MEKPPEKRKPIDLFSLFAEDEKIMEIDPNWSEEELLAQEGVFAFSKLVDTLGLDKKRVREFAKAQKNKGVDIYDVYGLKKMEGGQWRVRMKHFRKKLNELRNRFSTTGLPGKIQKVPKDIDRDSFFKLRGYFKLKDVLSQGYLPYDLRELLGILNKENLPPEQCGCYKGLKDWFVDFVPFIVYLYARYQKLPVDKVREALGLADE